MDIYRLEAKDYDELIGLLDTTFSHKYGRRQSFEEELPKMCVRDDEHMGQHIGIRRDGRLVAALGIYPLPCTVGGIPLMFSTVGNVATHPDYEGNGYMTELLDEAMRELGRIGADASRLGGLRQRYNRYGYESCGSSVTFSLTPVNAAKKLPGYGEGIEFKPIERGDLDSLEYTLGIYEKGKIVVDRRGMPDLYNVDASLRAWKNVPHVAYDASGRRIGYLSAIGGGIAEWGAEDLDSLCHMLVAWQKKCANSISFKCPVYDVEVMRRFAAICESHTLASPSHFKIISWAKVVDAFMKLKASYSPLPDGCTRIAIDGYGTIEAKVESGVASCTRTEAEADVTLDRLSAARYIFGPYAPSATAPSTASAEAFFPLPLGWNLQDRV